MASHNNTAAHLVCLPDGKSYVIGTAPLTIGREPSSNVPVHSEEVSRSHAYILRTPQGFLLVDSSLHGTYVNAERVQAQRILADGDVVQIGSHSFRFDLRNTEADRASPAPASHAEPETSQYARPAPPGARPTGKLGLALALGEQDIVEEPRGQVDQALRPQRGGWHRDGARRLVAGPAGERQRHRVGIRRLHWGGAGILWLAGDPRDDPGGVLSPGLDAPLTAHPK